MKSVKINPSFLAAKIGLFFFGILFSIASASGQTAIKERTKSVRDVTQAHSPVAVTAKGRSFTERFADRQNKQIAADIYLRTGVLIKYENFSTAELLDVQRRITVARRINENHGVVIDWEACTFSELVLQESRLNKGGFNPLDRNRFGYGSSFVQSAETEKEGSSESPISADEINQIEVELPSWSVPGKPEPTTVQSYSASGSQTSGSGISASAQSPLRQPQTQTTPSPSYQSQSTFSTVVPTTTIPRTGSVHVPYGGVGGVQVDDADEQRAVESQSRAFTGRDISRTFDLEVPASGGSGGYYNPSYRPSVGDHYVDGYYRADGTYVQGHFRTNPDDSFWNNYSSYGNVNPYTGAVGTRLPSSSYRSSSGTISVRGYYRKDGTYVRPHTRRR